MSFKLNGAAGEVGELLTRGRSRSVALKTLEMAGLLNANRLIWNRKS